MDSLQRFQDRAISIIDTARIKEDWSNNFVQVKQLITFDRSVMTYKIMNRLCPENLWNKFQRRSHYSNYNCENQDFVRTFKSQSIIWNILKRDFLTQL